MAGYSSGHVRFFLKVVHAHATLQMCVCVHVCACVCMCVYVCMHLCLHACQQLARSTVALRSLIRAATLSQSPHTCRTRHLLSSASQDRLSLISPRSRAPHTPMSLSVSRFFWRLLCAHMCARVCSALCICCACAPPSLPLSSSLLFLTLPLLSSSPLFLSLRPLPPSHCCASLPCPHPLGSV